MARPVVVQRMRNLVGRGCLAALVLALLIGAAVQFIAQHHHGARHR